MIKVLYVEDEAFLARIVKETLEKKGFQVNHVLTGTRAMGQFVSFEPDICILDIMLPHKNGFEIAEEIRAKDPQIPILFLTAKDQTEDLVKGFESGGNDYIKKPFSLEELTVRMNNLLALSGNKPKLQNKSLEIEISANAVFHPQKLQLIIAGEKITLSLKESQILELLSQNINGVTDRKDILMKVWNDDSYFNSRNLDVYIRKLRKHFEKDETTSIITLKGLGYQFTSE